MPRLLIETQETPVLLEKVASKNGKLIARGEFGRVGVPTANGRNYPRYIMEREINRLSDKLANRMVLGELDHPVEGKTSLKRVSHVITGLKIKNGVIIGEAEILNTREGKQLRALVEANIPVGVSSRGRGSTQPGKNTDEGDVVQDDFVLGTYDFVSDPAVSTALPGIYNEDIDVPVDETIAEMFLSEFPEVAEKIRGESEGLVEGKGGQSIEKRIKEAEKKIKAELSEKFEKQLANTLIEARADVSKELKEGFSQDPEVGGAKAALALVYDMVSPYFVAPDEDTVKDAIKAKDMEVAEAVEERDKAVSMAKLAAWSLFVEREVKNHPMCESILKLVKVQDCKSLDEVKEKLEAVMSDLPEVDDNSVSEEEVEYRENSARLEGTVALLEGKVDELRAKLQKSVKLAERIDEQYVAATLRADEADAEKDKAIENLEEASNLLKVEVYKRDKVVGLSNGRALFDLLEGVSSTREVDRVVKSKGATSVSDGMLEEMRQSLKKGTSNTDSQELTEGSSHQSVRKTDDFGNSMVEMRELVGNDLDN
jgi:hypothetical protein